VTEQVDIKHDYFSQTKRNCLIHSWLTVHVVFTYVCVVAYLLDIIKKHTVQVQPIILNQLKRFRLA